MMILSKIKMLFVCNLKIIFVIKTSYNVKKKDIYDYLKYFCIERECVNIILFTWIMEDRLVNRMMLVNWNVF